MSKEEPCVERFELPDLTPEQMASLHRHWEAVYRRLTPVIITVHREECDCVECQRIRQVENAPLN